MKLTFILFAFFFNFFNSCNINAEEIIDSSNNKIEKNVKGENSIIDESVVEKIHIVKVGDTITSISKFYSIEKELILQLNNLKNENYIYVGQNLKISNSTQKTPNNKYQKIFHLVQRGENLTEISAKYGLDLNYLIEINDIIDKDAIEVGSKIFLIDKNITNEKRAFPVKDKVGNNLVNQNNKTYGPLTIKQSKLEELEGRKTINALNKNNKKIILSINCETKDLDVKIPGRQWRGWVPAKEEFEKNLINDFC